MDEHKNLDEYNFKAFESEPVSKSKRKASAKNARSKSVSPDYGDNFNSQTGQDAEDYSYAYVDESDEAYYSRNSAPPGTINPIKKKKKDNSKSTAIFLLVFAIIVIVAAIVFTLTKCTDDKHSFKDTTKSVHRTEAIDYTYQTQANNNAQSDYDYTPDVTEYVAPIATETESYEPETQTQAPDYHNSEQDEENGDIITPIIGE